MVAVAGITAYRSAFGQKKAVLGRQPEDLAGAELWVVPNPSGLNAHATIATLAEAYAEPARAAGILRPSSAGDHLLLAEHGQPVLDDEAALLVLGLVDADPDVRRASRRSCR